MISTHTNAANEVESGRSMVSEVDSPADQQRDRWSHQSLRGQ